jgi:hypothetical protein
MHKLRLDIDDLHVETFALAADPSTKAGTVKGNADLVGGEVGIVYPASQDGRLETCYIDFCANSWQSGCLTCAGTCANTAPCATCDITGCVSCQVTCETCYGATCVTACLQTCGCA